MKPINEEFDQALVAYENDRGQRQKSPGLGGEGGTEDQSRDWRVQRPVGHCLEGVADLLAKGIKNLPTGPPLGMAIGGILGIVIALLEEFLPEQYVKWIPSATGLGLAGVIIPQNSFSMFLGSLDRLVLG